MRDLKKRHTPLQRSVVIVVIYLCAGWLWITFSDAVAEAWISDTRMLSRVQTWKGLLFVLVTGGVLFAVLLAQFRKDCNLIKLQQDQREALRQQERQLAVLMGNLPGMAYRCRFDEHWTVLFASEGCQVLTGYAPDELVDNRVASYASLIDPESTDEVSRAVEASVAKDEPFSIEYALRRKDGQTIWVWERGRCIDDDGDLVLEGIVLDISDRKALEEELSELATNDPLTGLNNRREMTHLLEEEVARATRYGREVAFLWIDFDHFKEINDSFGHAAGDAVLRNVSHLLVDGIRTVDSVGRFGGEEFVILLPEMGVEEAREAAERLRQRVHETPIPLDTGETVPLTISIGIAVFPQHGRSPEALCAAADKAMYRAKQFGRNCVVMASAPAEAQNS
ncbi:diguanylate cyclase [Marinobacter lipolyticus SM19]|uniref:Diguanylate cyclase n=1 Tax=Marinobacter lipolyticus SM19 TaxID=1318628 RepID=R8B0K8_9GAMM|nr:sensor domain-containing diguanylate cyclase [Marinobacter lipolyticus]EON92119.1 diguanylate cyclase [Marinobacter lipolyticus SM19]